jgi:hypothetical protein
MFNERAKRPFISGTPFSRRADRVWPPILTGLILIVTAPLWLLGIAVLFVLGVARPLIIYPLGFAAFGALFASVWFAATGAWFDALQAAMLALIASGLLAAYGALFDRFKLQDSREAAPPWWWYV